MAFRRSANIWTRHHEYYFIINSLLLRPSVTTSDSPKPVLFLLFHGWCDPPPHNFELAPASIILLSLLLLRLSAAPHNFEFALASNCFIIIACGLGNYATIIRLFLLLHFLPSGGTRYSSGAICSWGEWEHLNMRPPYLLDSLPLAIMYILLGCWHLCYTNYILLGYRYFYRVKSSLDNGTYATFI